MGLLILIHTGFISSADIIKHTKRCGSPSLGYHLIVVILDKLIDLDLSFFICKMGVIIWVSMD